MDAISSVAEKIINILGKLGRVSQLYPEKNCGKENRGRGLGIRRGLLLGIRVITVESVNSPGRDKMKNKLPFDVTPRGGARTYTHTRTRTVGSRIV